MEIIIYELVIALFGWFLSLGGIILNYAINDFVIGFGTQFKDNGIGFVVDQSWAALRDLFNIVFIFGLVAIGFKMILRVNDSNSKRWLVMLILAALLVNFSLFISKFVVDFSNIVAVEMINEGMRTETFGTTVFRPDGDKVNVSGSMKDILQLNTILDKNPALSQPKKSWGLIFGTMIIYIVGGFVFMSAGIMLIIRAAVLIVLMIASPFLFIGMVFPGLSSSSSKLWKMLFTRAFFAPIYITFLYITLKVSGDFMSAVGGNSNVAGALLADGSGPGADANTVGGTFGPFIIITSLLMISLIAAQRIGAEGGATAIKMGKSAMGYGRKQLGRGAARGTGALARNTVGRAAYNAANSERGLQRASGGFVDRQIAGFYRKAAATSFDARSEKGSKYGTKRKGGYAANQEATKKKEKEYAKTLEREPYDSSGNPKADFEEMRNNDVNYKYANSEMEVAKAEKEAAEQQLEAAKIQLENQKASNDYLNNLKSQLVSSTDDGEKANLSQMVREEEDRMNSEFQKNNETTITRANNARTREKKAKSNVDVENTRLEGEYKYHYVDKLRETRAAEKARWKAINESGDDTVNAGVVGAGIGMMFAGPIGAAVGAAAGMAIKKAATNAFVDGADAQLSELTKEYGKDGRKKVKDKGKNDILKNLKKELDKEGGDTPTAETT